MLDEFADGFEEPIHVIPDLFLRPIPPGNALQTQDCLLTEPVSHDRGWVAHHNGVWWDVGKDNRTRTHDGAIPNRDAAGNECLKADPDIVGDDCIPSRAV